jgi:hypothetical protein
VITELKRFFIDFGVPEQLVSDNGKQFDSAEFRQFCNALNIRSTTSSPKYPRSNGLVERMVQTVKESFIKSQSEGKNLLDTLQVLRSTPLGNRLPTPAVILQRRNLRGGLLFTPQQLKNFSSTFVREKLEQRQSSQFFYSAGRKKYLSPLAVGNPVRVRVEKKWIPGIIQSVCSEPNSYVVSTNCGRLFRRNRQAINLDKSHAQLCRTQQKIPSVESSRPAVSINQPMRRSINFIGEWQSSSSVPVSTPTLAGNRSNSIIPTVSELGDPEDFMLAFHGFGTAGVRPPSAGRPPSARGRPRRSKSTGGEVSSPSQRLRLSSLEDSNVRVTRSCRVYGARHLQ